MKKGALLLMIPWVCILFPTAGLQAQTPLMFDDIGCGPRATAMGQAFTAVADDASAAYYNPAGLTQIPTHFVFSMGYQYVKPKIHISVKDNKGNPYKPQYLLEQRDLGRLEDRGTGGMFMSIGTNFAHLSVFNDPPSFMRNVALGFAFFYALPDINTFWNPQREQDPYHLRYNYGYCLMNIAMSAGYRITDWLSVGVGMLPRMDTFQKTTQSYIDILKYIEDPSDAFRLRFKTRLKVHAEMIMGVRFQPPIRGLQDKLSLGVSFRREISGYYGTGLSSEDVVYIDPNTGNKYLIFPINAQSVDFIGFNPAQLTGGIAVKPFPGMTLAVDVTWKDYSKFRFFWAIPPEPRFHDTLIPRVGLEYFFDPDFKARFIKKIAKIRFQGGYYYEPTPVPDMNGKMNILDSDKHVGSIGAGLDYRMKGLRMLKIQSYFQVHFAEEKILTNERDPLFGVIRTGGEVYSTGISVTIEL